MTKHLAEATGDAPEPLPKEVDGSLRVCQPVPEAAAPINAKRRSVVRAQLIENRRDLPGLRDHDAEAFADEISRSLAGERWITTVSSSSSAPQPLSGAGWDPLRAIAEWNRIGDKEEATWVAFLTTHLGSHGTEDPWASVRNLYSGFGEGRLTWELVSSHPSKIEDLRAADRAAFEQLRFGNHRKYESREQIGAVVASYVDGMRRLGRGSQAAFFMGQSVKGRPSFGQLMKSLDFIRQFGRLARYDLLCLLGNLGVYDLVPDRLYLEGATGPLRGARLMFGLDDPIELDRRGCNLAKVLAVSIQVMEDALCNWQKHI